MFRGELFVHIVRTKLLTCGSRMSAMAKMAIDMRQPHVSNVENGGYGPFVLSGDSRPICLIWLSPTIRLPLIPMTLLAHWGWDAISSDNLEPVLSSWYYLGLVWTRRFDYWKWSKFPYLLLLTIAKLLYGTFPTKKVSLLNKNSLLNRNIPLSVSELSNVIE